MVFWDERFGKIKRNVYQKNTLIYGLPWNSGFFWTKKENSAELMVQQLTLNNYNIL
jgi:hypothetical protein